MMIFMHTRDHKLNYKLKAILSWHWRYNYSCSARLVSLCLQFVSLSPRSAFEMHCSQSWLTVSASSHVLQWILWQVRHKRSVFLEQRERPFPEFVSIDFAFISSSSSSSSSTCNWFICCWSYFSCAEPDLTLPPGVHFLKVCTWRRFFKVLNNVFRKHWKNFTLKHSWCLLLNYILTVATAVQFIINSWQGSHERQKHESNYRRNTLLDFNCCNYCHCCCFFAN